MTMAFDHPKDSDPPVPDATPDATPDELVKLVRKLRWIGAEDEAQRVLKDLTRGTATTADSVLAAPGDTD
jgi:hypothetical protein